MPIHTAIVDDYMAHWDLRPAAEYGSLALAGGLAQLRAQRQAILDRRIESGTWVMLADDNDNILEAQRKAANVIYPQLWIAPGSPLTNVQKGRAILALAAVLWQAADARWPDASLLVWELDGRPTNATIRNTIVNGLQAKGVALTLIAPNLWRMTQTAYRGFTWP